MRPNILDSPLALEAVAFTCKSLGAVAFLDIADYQQDADRGNAGGDRAIPGLVNAAGHRRSAAGSRQSERAPG